ncbi:MAG TPA: hypothetical protein VD838_03545, partial [Anaeromyxobacteraceae bacterium]|nr:hypothetical protein [Anaeromyxobacteraceae bacterium]
MADQRSVLKEYRFLDEKRRTQGLSREEQERLEALRDVVGDAAPAQSRSGFDVNAAAARLRESLLPAGLRRPPPTPAVLEPEPEPLVTEAPELAAPEPEAAWDAPSTDAPGEAPAETTDLLFDPASL